MGDRGVVVAQTAFADKRLPNPTCLTNTHTHAHAHAHTQEEGFKYKFSVENRSTDVLQD